MNKSMETLPKILCVDDEEAILKSLKRVLQKDFTVLTAATGEEALSSLNENPDCSVILSDYQLPGISGIELLQSGKMICPNAVRAILSGHIDLSIMEKAINNAEIHRFLLKPWNNDYLLLQMKEALMHQQLLSEKNILQKIAVTDPITKLSNHRFFQQKFKVALEHSQEINETLSLMMIDVDHFKSFNDQYGHPEGDVLLASIAQRISENIRDCDILSRYGGEEFTLIMPNTQVNKAKELAENIRKAVERKPFAGPYGRLTYITISLGISSIENGKTTNELLNAADKALYQAKKQGRNQTVLAQ